ncbi:MAG: DUF6580 family putative transport protein [Niabella sp.]
MKKINTKIGLVLVMILLAAFSRIIPHPYNFTPLVAMALFGGAMMDKKWMAYLMPITAYLLSDVIFSLFGAKGFYGISQIFVYGAMLLVTALGTTMGNPKPLKVVGYSLSGSAIFWIISNFGVWFGNYLAAGTATHEAGLTLGVTYLRALPFYNMYSNELFVNAFAGDLFYSVVLFGIYALVQKRIPAMGYSKN